ncbi:MAG: AmmeMemoRadiSam system radical SAM enzyme [Candidatus Aminicenantes bacterium]
MESKIKNTLKEAFLYRRKEDHIVDCHLCHHRCRIQPSEFGFCGVRENRSGKLVTHVYGNPIALHVDPIEKKPLYHFLPGSRSYSIATIGCNFHCAFCQNWQISQANKKDGPFFSEKMLMPQDIVREAKKSGCRSISYTYTEPTVFFEYAYDTAVLAKKENMANVFVTNGYMTPEALEKIKPHLDACNVDLKSFRDEFYRTVCKARLKPVLDSIRLMKEMEIWVEATTLVVPGQNDSVEELERIARFLVEVDPDIPWHLSRFHPDYECQDAAPTPVEVLRKAARIGREAGLKFIYIGNVLGESMDTACPNCGKTVLSRAGFSLQENRIHGGQCGYCAHPVAGVFE